MLSARRYIGIAAVSAFAAAMLFFMFLQRLNARTDAAIAERREAVVVAKQAEPGQLLTEDMLIVKKVFPANVPESAVTDPGEAIGKTASVRLYSGEVLLRDRLGAVSRVSAAGAVPRDHVAFALAIRAHTGVAGLIAPGDRIDLLGVVSADDKAPVHILLSNIRVVGEAGRSPLADPIALSAATPTPAPTTASRLLILDLEPEQAETLADALETSTVYVALRSSRR